MSDEKTAEAPADTQDVGVNLDAPPEVKEETAKTEDAASDVKAEESTDEKTDEGEAKPKKPSGAQRAKLREEYLRNENRELLRQLEASKRQSNAAGEGAKEEPAPKEEDFNGDWTAFLAAKSAHEARKAVREEFANHRKSELEVKQVDLTRERTLAHLDRVEEAKEVIADWDTVIGSAKGLSIHEDVMGLIIESDKSPLLAYHLAKNPDKLRELNSLSGRELAREIGRLEGSIRMPAGKKQTTAPPPPTILKGGSAPDTDLGSADMEAYVAARKAQGYK